MNPSRWYCNRSSFPPTSPFDAITKNYQQTLQSVWPWLAFFLFPAPNSRSGSGNGTRLTSSLQSGAARADRHVILSNACTFFAISHFVQFACTFDAFPLFLLQTCHHSFAFEMSSEEIDVGRRSSSPPGRESREDWKGGERNTTTDPSSDTKQTTTTRSRSRSPRSKSPGYQRDRRESREQRYTREGTNTNSREPHLQRARLFVGNIEPNTTHRRDVIELFSRYGEVLGVSVHKGYAFVQMDRERNANRAINGEDNRMFKGSRIRK